MNIKDYLDHMSGEKFYPVLLALHRRFSLRAQKVEFGRNRAVYIFDKYVVKLPIDWGGITDNDWEGSVENGPDEGMDEIQFARTRLFLYQNEIPVLFMERIEYVTDEAIIKKLGYYPDWIYNVDCGQVGFNSKGQLKAFDYGLL